MDKKSKINQEVDKTLQAFSEAERLPKDPFFYTRLQAGIEEQEKKKRIIPESMLRGRLRPAFLVGIVALNVLTAVFVLEKSGTQISRQDRIQAFAETYALGQSQTNVFLFNE